MVATQNRDLEETIVISAIPQAGGQEIKLFSQHVKIIRRHGKEKNGLPALKSLVPRRKETIQAGSTVTVNFTVRNDGHDEEFLFKVCKWDSQHELELTSSIPVTDQWLRGWEIRPEFS